MVPATSAMAGRSRVSHVTQQRLFGCRVGRRRGHLDHLHRPVGSGHQRSQEIHAVFDVVMLGVKKHLDQIGVALGIRQGPKAGTQEKGLGLDAGIVAMHRGPGTLHQHGQPAAEGPVGAEAGDLLLPPGRGDHGPWPVVHQGGELLHVRHPGTLQGAFLRGREQGDDGEVVTFGRVNEAEGVGGAAIAFAR